MNTLLIGDIRISPERIRKDFSSDKHSDLKASILKNGLYHAVVISENNELVAGERRIRAIREIYLEGKPIMYDGKEVPFGQVPYSFTHQTDARSLLEIELQENTHRQQINPIEEAEALARLHRTLVEDAPELVPGIKQEVTFQETAKVLGEITGQPQTNDAQRIADAIIVDKFKDHPDVKRAGSAREAARLAKKAMERQFREVLGGMKVAPKESRHRVLQGPCEEMLAQIPDGTVDCIIADPPYGIGADSFGEQSRVGHEYQDDIADFFKVIHALQTHASRICKADAAMFIFLDIEQFFRMEEDLYHSVEDGASWCVDWLPGWYIWPTPLIWHKPNKGHAPQPKRGPSRRYEAILYAIRGNREVRKVGSDVLTFPVPDNREHGAGKPAELYQELLSWVCYPGDLVLDPCAGSGPVVSAADALDCAAIAIERDPAFVTMIKERIK